MHRLLWQSNKLFHRSQAAIAHRSSQIFSSSSTVLKPNKLNGLTERPRGNWPEVERLGIRRFLDIHKSSSLLLSAKERAESFDNLWSQIKKVDPVPEIDLVNKYLYCVMDCGMSFDAKKILQDLKEIELKPNIRTFGAFIRQSCSRGNMEETSYYLQLLQEAHMVPDSNIFSKILYGYLKAGSPEEVASTQEIMKQLGSWPSRIGYEGILTAYAELGDRASLLGTLNEACDVLTHWSSTVDDSRSSLPFSNVFLVQLYVQLHCSEASSEEPCTEILSRLPLSLDPASHVRARDGIKRLLVFGRAEAAAELFKRTDPESADDSYLVSLTRYAAVGGLEMDSTFRIWRLADATGARLNMLKRISSSNLRRQSPKVSDLFAQLQDSFKKGDIEGIFKAIESKKTDASATLYNHAIPQLMHLGLKPEEILQRIEPASARPAAAFGCLLGTLVPVPKDDGTVPVVDMKAANELVCSLRDQKLLPYDDFVSVSPFVCRRLLYASIGSPDGSVKPDPEALAEKITVLSSVLSTTQTKAIVAQLFETALYSSRYRSVNPPLSARDQEAVRVLVDACLIKNIKFPPNNWIFYSLENAEIPAEKCEKLMLTELHWEPPTEVNKPLSLGRRLRTAIESKNMDGAAALIQRIGQSNSSSERIGSHPVSQTSLPLRSFQMLDPVAIAFDVIRLQTNKSDESSHSNDLTASDVERLFWISWETQILPNALRAIGQVATSFLLKKDIDGLAAFFDRASKQFGSMLEAIMTPQNMKALLEHNFTANLTLLEQMSSHPFLPIHAMASIVCTLENLIHECGTNTAELKQWKPGSPEYLPVQILNERLQGVSHLQKLRNIHNAVESLCRSNNLYAAHSLRLWATQMGLLLLPKTTEMLLLTPYFTGAQFRAYPLEKWALSHELCQHTPVSLDIRQLRALDELITLDNTESSSSSTSVCQDTATWLVHNVTEPRSQASTQDSAPTNVFPTWLVVAQHLQHNGSYFGKPSTWFVLCMEWLNQVPESTTWLQDLIDWIRFSPSVEYQCALLLAGLLSPKSHDWVEQNYLNKTEWVFALAVSEAMDDFQGKQEKRFSELLSRYNEIKTVVELAQAISATPVDKTKIQYTTNNELIRNLALLVSAKPSLKPNVLQFLIESHPDLFSVFLNELLTEIKIRPRYLRLVRQIYDDLLAASQDVSLLDLDNQALLYASSRVLDQTQHDLPPPLTHFYKLFDSERANTWHKEVPAAISRQDFSGLLELLEKCDPSKRLQAFGLLTYALPRIGETHRLNKFLTVVAEQMDGHLLNEVALRARPFITYGMGEAFLALARFYRDENLDWFDRACVRYHKLGPLLQARGSSPVRQRTVYTARPTDSAKEISSILRMPLSSVAESLIKAQADPEMLEKKLSLVSTSWSTQRCNALLAYLTAEGASEVIERVIALTRKENRTKQLPFKAFAAMIRAHSGEYNDMEEAQEIIQSALDSLAETPSTDIASCLKGPHVESLFRCWPNEKLLELIKLVQGSSPTERSSINLQLASILVNRGRRDLADQLIKVTGPLPVTFLAGSPRHTLSPEDFRATLNYLRESDPDHITAFVDTCLRNAASTTSPNTDKIVSLVRVITTGPQSFNLSQVCLLPTLNLLAEFLRRNPKLPADIKNLLDLTVEYKGIRRQINPQS